MFEHVLLFLSFIYAIALTHLFSSSTELILARDRVRPSGLLIAWMVLALLILVTNWLSAANLSGVQHWTLGRVLLEFATAGVQYFTCSLVSMRVEPQGEADMPVFFAKHRPVIASSMVALGVIAMLENYVDRSANGLTADAWIGEDLSVLPMTLVGLAAALFPARWVQWVAVVVLLAGVAYFLSQFVALG
ncbi:hypothetical protein [Phenylobacterium sp.]|uniref:hypothetical protein n=1 Tax=Phenylobacterium sp. TaxID=1871053 RepID=UPI002C1347E7|nr:hypothetical protein [Phenylobacterium sp.]HLZ77392.1 hypothetical protein [Phenylobacterium sp.]